MAFEVDPEEQVEFCLEELARPRGAFWPEKPKQRPGTQDAEHTWVQWEILYDWAIECLPRGNWLRIKLETGRCQIGRKCECSSKVQTWSYKPVVPKPGCADSWTLSTTSLIQSWLGLKSPFSPRSAGNAQTWLGSTAMKIAKRTLGKGKPLSQLDSGQAQDQSEVSEACRE